ncbi:unnamed protein product [Merluccius merluccius]
MEVSGQRVSGRTPPHGTCGSVPTDADEAARPLTAENCYEMLRLAKRRGLADLQDRVYGFMSDHYLEVLRNPAVYGRLAAGERERVLARRLQGRRVLAVAEVDEVPGGGPGPPQSPQTPQTPASPEREPRRRRRIFCHDERTQAWRALSELPERVCTRGAGMCTLFNYLFVAGGLVGGAPSDRVFSYNPRTDAWAEARPLAQARAQLKLVAADGHLYAIGGECLLTVERYDPRADRWSRAAPLPRGAFAVAHEAAACGGALFVSGGSLSYRLLRLDGGGGSGDWEECAFSRSGGRSADMVAHGGFLYRFDVSRGRGVHVFRYDTVLRAWHGGASCALPGAAPPLRCAALGSRIYCVSGARALQFAVDADRDGVFLPEVLRTPAEARGTLVPFVLALPEPDRTAGT